jgi:hypothetical protein
MTKTDRLMLFTEVIAVYCENHGKHINVVRAQSRSMLKQIVHVVTLSFKGLKKDLRSSTAVQLYTVPTAYSRQGM